MPNDIMQILDPQTAADQIALQRRMAFADALRQQSMQPMGGTDAIGGVAIQKSPLEGIAKMFQGYSANKINQQTDADRKAMATRQAQYYSALLGGGTTNPGVASSAALTSGALQGDVGPTNSNAARMDNMMAQGNGTAPRSDFNLPNLLRSGMVEQLGGAPAASAFWEQYKPTEATRMALAAGLDPRSANAATLQKNTYIPPTSLRGRAYMTLDAQGNQRLNTLPDPAQPGYMNQVDANGNWSTAPIRGGLEAVANSTAARTEAEKAAQNRQTLLSPDMSPRDAQGRVIPTTIGSMIGGGSRQPSMQMQGQATQPQGVGLALGQEAGATNAQTELSKKYGALQDQNANAQTVISNLDNIKQMATKAAVGPFSDKADFINGLISTFVPGEQKRATDAVTANDLLEKYGNQIVAKLGQGGLGTDAARAILQSAYPNSHMTQQAINDAADNIKGAQQIMQAKTSLLSPHGNARDPVAYQQKEQVFDQNADPRIFQLKNMDAASAQKYLSTLPPQVAADLRQKAIVLKQLGVF